MLSERISLKHELFGAWNAPFFSVGTLVGWLTIARFIDPASADLTAAETKQWFTVDHRDGVLLGCSIFLLSSGPAFTHSGTFAFHGFLGFYLPVIIWGAWMDAHAFFMRLDVRRRMKQEQAGAPATTPALEMPDLAAADRAPLPAGH